jgi:hypothetical protein
VTFNGGTQVNASMFKDLTQLQTVVLNEGMTTIGEEAFSGCTTTVINIPTTVTSIGDRAFMGCTSFTEVDLSQATYIGYGAFEGCSNLAKIEIPFIGRSAGTTGLFGEIFNSTLGTDSPNTTRTNTSAVPSALKTVVFWGNDLYAGATQGAFEGCGNITTVIMMTDLHSDQIPANTFEGCTSLSKIVVPGNVEFVRSEAFMGCNALATIYFGGTASDWNNISIEANNGRFSTATRYYSGQWSYDPATGLPVAN